MSPPAGALRVRAVLADRGLDVAFDVGPGEVLAILGPNGAGKSSLLHVIAGLLRPDTGLVRLGPRVLTDTGAGIDVPTRERRVGLLMQDPLLFPHLSVAANVGFGPRARRRSGAGRSAAAATARGWLAAVGAEELADRRPRRLSGGQAQRVAIARALAAEPEVLLLDEPLAGLDVAGAAAVRAVLRAVIAADSGGRRSAVLVTHDLLDVFALADRVLVLESGRVAEIGRTAEILGTPRSAFGARIAGLNLVGGRIRADGALVTPAGDCWHGVAGEVGLAAGSAAVAVFAPAAVAVYRQAQGGSPRNCVPVIVAGLDARGATVTVRGADGPDGAPGPAADITAEAAAELGLTVGESAWFCVKAQEVALRPAIRPGPQP